MATTNKKSTIVLSKRYFPVEIAVFEHTDGDSRPSYTVKLTRSFRRNEGSEWETTDYLSPQDLLPAARLAGRSVRSSSRPNCRRPTRSVARHAAETVSEEVTF